MSQEKSTSVSDTHLIGMINFMPPFDAPISYGPLERIWNFKKQIREMDPNWLLADEITLLEHQVLNQIDVIDITAPWNSARNKLRYIDLYQTIVKRVSWFKSSLLLRINNKHIYKY